MKPEDLLDPETLPDDLRWLEKEFRLSPKDPVFLLIAWHWHRVAQAEDCLARANLELQTAVDARIESIAKAGESAALVSEALERVQAVLEAKPRAIAAQLEHELKASADRVKSLSETIGSIVQRTEAMQAKSRAREILGLLLSGVALGVVSTVILLLR